MLGAAPAGDHAERRLELTEDRRLARGKAHVARQHELAAGAAYATLDLRDGDEAACAQMAKQQGDRRLAGQLRRLRPVLLDPGHVDVGNEVVGVGALEHEHLDGVVGLGLLNEGDQIADQLGPQKIHGRGRDLREQNGPFLAHGERLEIHGENSLPPNRLSKNRKTLKTSRKMLAAITRRAVGVDRRNRLKS